MSERTFRAALSQSQGREGWAVIFRHPLKIDNATGKPGRRVRRGLGTKDRSEAEALVDGLNELLADKSFWQASARPLAERRFGLRPSEIFYQDISAETWDFWGIRNAEIALPSSQDSSYRRVLLAGTTGSGKTTLVRQLLGTDPVRERFPSTSTAKTTVAETELVIAEGDYRAVVTFMPRDQVRDYIEENISAAVLACYRGAADDEVLRRVLNHIDQRFRLSYVLGTGTALSEDDLDADELDFEDEDSEAESGGDGAVDQDATREILLSVVRGARQLATRHAGKLRDELNATKEDERVIEELFEDNLDSLLREDDDYFQLSDAVMEEVERRFELLTIGSLVKTTQGWPRSWTWQTADRAAFLRAVSRFSSNYAPHFGTLLTPVVNGIRVIGPFGPSWLDERPSLVLLDGEGLGHTPESSSSVSTSMTRRFDDVDAVLLVDNAAQPMQAAPVALMRSLVSIGQASKLVVCFTHFDQVVGDNLLGFSDKEQHVLASAENALTALGEQLGPYAERALRSRLEKACFFVGSIQSEIHAHNKRGARTISQLRAVLEAVEQVTEPATLVDARPKYDRADLTLAIQKAAENFHSAWRARLGKDVKLGVFKEHWTRVKALTRRFAEGWADEYDYLKPVADLHRELQEELFRILQSPTAWTGPVPDDEAKNAIFAALANSLSRDVLELSARRVKSEHVADWQNAYTQSGRGSSFARASIIVDNIYAPAAPVPGVAATPQRNEFLQEIMAALRRSAEAVGAELN